MYNEINQYDFILECNRFIEDNIAAPYIAFYLSKGYSLDALGQGTFMQHFNSAADVFNIDFIWIIWNKAKLFFCFYWIF